MFIKKHKKRLSTTIDEDLLSFVQQEAKLNKATVNQVLEEAIEFLKKEKLKKELAEGYKETAELDLQICREWDNTWDLPKDDYDWAKAYL